MLLSAWLPDHAPSRMDVARRVQIAEAAPAWACTMEFDRYEEVPASMVEKLMEKEAK